MGVSKEELLKIATQASAIAEIKSVYKEKRRNGCIKFEKTRSGIRVTMSEGLTTKRYMTLKEKYKAKIEKFKLGTEKTLEIW